MADAPSTVDVFNHHVDRLLSDEFERRKVLEARGENIIKTSTAIITIILGFVVFISGKDYKFTNHWHSTWILVGSLVLFVLSSLVAIYVQSWALAQKFTSEETLNNMTQDFWDMPADDAARMCLQRNINALLSLRAGNAKKVAAAQWGIILQVFAATVLGVALLCELVGHH